MKTVLFSQRVEVIDSYKERRDCADQKIAEFISSIGFLPIPAPNNSNIAESLINELKPAMIILTGGNSMVEYGGNAPERDDMDNKLIELAIKNNIPLYGFCRGMQSILSYFGNTLETVRNHVALYHNVHGIINDNVNSYHNFGCKKLIDGCELEITAISDDGVIEAVKHKRYLIIGTMWHPEREMPFRNEDKKYILDLIKGEVL